MVAQNQILTDLKKKKRERDVIYFKTLKMVTTPMKLKDAGSLEENL